MSTPAGPAADKHLRRGLDPVAAAFQAHLAAGRIATTSCPGGHGPTFPPRERCATCGAGQTWIELGSRAELYAFTTQETALRFAAPSVLAVVEVRGAAGVRLPAVGDGPVDRLRVGQEVELATREIPEIGFHVVAFAAT